MIPATLILAADRTGGARPDRRGDELEPARGDDSLAIAVAVVGRVDRRCAAADGA